MAAFVPFLNLSFDVLAGNHAIGGAGVVYKVALSNSAPLNTYSRFNQITDLTVGNGYAAGGNPATLSISNSGATTTVFGPVADVTFTAAGGTMATFRYAILYKFSPGATTSVRPLVGFWDYGVGQVLVNGDKFIVDFNNTAGFLQIS